MFAEYEDCISERLSMARVYDDAITLFELSETHEERVRFSLKLIDDQGSLPPKSLVISRKNGARAVEVRISGDHHFAKKEYLSALQLYNEALCFCEKGTENMGMAYANRSAVYFMTGYYELCLENIELALQNAYPEVLKDKLIKRKNDCLYKINNGGEKLVKPKEIDIKLSYEPNPKIPFMVEGIDLKVNEKYGRHLIAKQNFNPGDILIIEKPFTSILSKDKVYSYCLYCMNSNLMNLKPCNESTCAMFCSDKCYEESLAKFFKFEGQILDALYEYLDKKLHIVRMVIKLLTLFEDFDDLKEFIDSIDLSKTTPFDIDYKTATEKDLFRVFYAFSTHEELRDNNILFSSCNWSAYVYYLIKQCTDLGQRIKKKEHQSTIMTVILRLKLITSIYCINSYTISPSRGDQDYLDVKGSQSNLITSLFSHSCVPNVRITGENVNALIVMLPIKAGDQIFVSYGPIHNGFDLEKRQQILKASYCFDCTCDACKNDYPQQNDLRNNEISVDEQLFITRYKINVTQPNDPAVIREMLNQCNQFLTKYGHNYPSLDICNVQAVQQKCTELLYFNKPLEFCFVPRK